MIIIAKVYDFKGATSFSTSIWVGGSSGINFTEPLSVHLDPKRKSNIRIEVYKSSKVGSVNTGTFETATNFPIDHLTDSGLYKIKLVNLDPEFSAELTGGQVYYNG